MGDVSCHKEKLVTGIVYEDEQVMEFMDMDPISKGQVLLVSKKHYLDVEERSNKEHSYLMRISKKAVSVLKRMFSKS